MESALALGFAGLCLLCAAANDLVFKLYTRRNRSLGAYALVIGLVWLASFGLIGWFDGHQAKIEPTLRWGVLSGVFSILANLLFLEGFKRQEAGICATIYRLNLAPAAVLAVLCLGESLTWGKAVGLLAAAGAVVLFAPRRNLAANSPFLWQRFLAGQWWRQPENLGWGLVALASLLRAGMGLTYKAGLERGADVCWLLALNGAAWMLGGLLYGLIRERGELRLTLGNEVKYGLISGVLVCGITLFLALALRLGEASRVLPITQLSFVLTAVAAAIWLKEGLGWRKLAGVGLALLGVLCLTIK